MLKTTPMSIRRSRGVSLHSLTLADTRWHSRTLAETVELRRRTHSRALVVGEPALHLTTSTQSTLGFRRRRVSAGWRGVAPLLAFPLHFSRFPYLSLQAEMLTSMFVSICFVDISVPTYFQTCLAFICFILPLQICLTVLQYLNLY